MENSTVRMARWSAKRPWWAIGGWLVFVVLCLGVGSAVGTHSATTADYRVGEAGHAEGLAAEGGLERRSAEQVLISSRSGAVDRDAAGVAARELTARMERLPDVAGVADPVWSKDRRILMVEVAVKGDERDAKDNGTVSYTPYAGLRENGTVSFCRGGEYAPPRGAPTPTRDGARQWPAERHPAG